MRDTRGILFTLMATAVLLVACGGSEQPMPEEATEAADVVIEPVEEAPIPKLDALPWTLEGLKETYTVGTTLTYDRSGTDEDGEEVSGTHTFEVVEVTDLIVAIDIVRDQGGGRSSSKSSFKWADAVLLESNPGSSSTEFEVVGEEQVETPVGTFDTIVVEVTNSFFETRDTYWLIADQPGVYAKWVEHGEADAEANIVMTLREIARPGS